MTPEGLRPELFTTDYSGEPGHRAFYLQVRAGGESHTLALEKQQVALLAEKLTEILLLIDARDPISALSPQRVPSLEAIFSDPSWRVGAIGLSYDDESDLVAVEVREVTDEEMDEESFQAIEDEHPGNSLRLLLERSQVRDFIVHALAVTQEGRPICPLCGLPMDTEGHACPATNGHHPSA